MINTRGYYFVQLVEGTTNSNRTTLKFSVAGIMQIPYNSNLYSYLPSIIQPLVVESRKKATARATAASIKAASQVVSN